MKTLKCDLCDHEARGNTFGEWIDALKPHYAAAHADVMAGKSGLTKEEQMIDMQKWMMTNKTRFEAQSES